MFLSAVTPLPEEFELQGFLALRPALRLAHSGVSQPDEGPGADERLGSDSCSVPSRSLDFTQGHQGILVERDGLPPQSRHQRLISLGKWVADNQPGSVPTRDAEYR